MRRFDGATVAVFAIFVMVSILTAMQPTTLEIVSLVGIGIILGFCVGMDVARG